MKKISIDKPLVSFTVLLASVGFFIFTSASFGLFARDKGFSITGLISDQFIGFVAGIVLLFIALNIPLKLLHKYAFHIFVASIITTLFVFIPYVGFAHGGAHRWIDLRFTSFQPSEFLKLGAVIYFAALLVLFRDKVKTINYTLGLFFGVFVIPAGILLAEPDTGTLAVLFVTLLAMLVASGSKLRYIILFVVIGVFAISVLAMVKPYVKERVLTFFNSSRDVQGASYQIQKSLLAIGSGGITGRGFGQSIQKFKSLPEPTGDSVFAVAGEEFGFIGGGFVIILFLLFGIRGIQIAGRTPVMFESLLAVGIVILIISQSFANIAAMLGLIPLTGVPLVFVSHGGTAILFAFLEVGILLNISKLSKI